MNIKQVDFDLPSVEYRTKSGQLKITKGCSLATRQAFDDTYTVLLDLLLPVIQDKSGMAIVKEIEALYEGNDLVRSLCHQCLKANGINPDDIGLAELINLLVTYQGGYALLKLLNTDPA